MADSSSSESAASNQANSGDPTAPIADEYLGAAMLYAAVAIQREHDRKHAVTIPTL